MFYLISGETEHNTGSTAGPVNHQVEVTVVEREHGALHHVLHHPGPGVPGAAGVPPHPGTGELNQIILVQVNVLDQLFLINMITVECSTGVYQEYHNQSQQCSYHFVS